MLKLYTEDVDLIAELNEIKEQRDKIAHKSFLMSVEEADDRKAIGLKVAELEAINESATSTLRKICARWKDIEETLNKLAAEQGAGSSGDPRP